MSISRYGLGRTVGRALLVAVGLVACDKDPPKSEPAAKAAPTSASAAAPSGSPDPTPAKPSKPQLAIDDSAVFVAGERVEIAGPDPKGKIALALTDKPVERETLVLNAARDTKVSKITTLLSVLIAKKVTAVEVHTPRRDRTDGQLVFTTTQKPADCSAVGFISKESAITAWPASGATAERFARGMAGPDLTRGSEGIRKRVLSCDAAPWFLGADENVTWGLVFDLALAVSHADDAGAIPSNRSLSFLTKTPVSGRKIEVE